MNNRPRDGYIYHEMKTTRARSKYTVRITRSIKDTPRADSLAKDLADGTIDAIQASTIHGEADMADY